MALDAEAEQWSVSYEVWRST